MELAARTALDSRKNLPDRKSSIGMAGYQNFFRADSVLCSYILALIGNRHSPIGRHPPVEAVPLTERYGNLFAVAQTDWNLTAQNQTDCGFRPCIHLLSIVSDDKQ